MLAGALLQIIPLPRGVIARLSPAADRISHATALVASTDPIPLSVNPRATTLSLAIAACCVLLFFSTRRLFAQGGLRTTIRLVAVAGVLLSALAMAQHATGRGTLYWTWRMTDVGATPFGPFVNRNHFATWAMMAALLCTGYLMSHLSARGRLDHGLPFRRRLAAALDGRVLLLFAAAAVLTIAVIVSLSRSGMLGVGVAAICGVLLARQRAGTAARPGLLLTLVLTVGIAALLQIDPSSLGGRLAGSSAAVADRITIWKDTVPVIIDSWLTGTGLGTFQTVMLVYQRSRLEVLFNQAHNHYLQIAAEGGLLVGVPVLLSLAAFIRAGARSLREDHSDMFWIRCSAAAGLAGVAAQSVWEVGLTTPANAALASVLAGALLHAPVRSGTARIR
ncbi:MAG: O-antigen ligase family protein [Acidobacteria bacterium]|nr:O-antigen ligase family protein [Acidobacteriota bacterium]